MSQYESFNDWWQDTKQWMKPSSKPAEEVDDEVDCSAVRSAGEATVGVLAHVVRHAGVMVVVEGA